jgi:molybdate-binding protein/DNA-binding XRE family transcriptional regulator
MTDAAPNRVRELREARGLTQVDLASASQLTRQSIGAIEASRATPAVDVALRIARALDHSVEELFGLGAPDETLVTEPVSRSSTGRVTVARVGERWVSHALDREGVRICADALAARARRRGVEAALLRPSAELRENVLILGCAPGLGLLADRLNSRPGRGRFVWLSRSSTEALEALARHQTHLAGVHLVDGKTGDANVPDVRRVLRGNTAVLITLARWELGLVVPHGNPKRIRSVADLGRRGVTLAVREPGSGARRLLDRELRAAGIEALAVVSPASRASGHLEVAQAITLGAADTGIASRDAALASGLDFVPLANERYDLVMPHHLLEDPRVQRLLDVMASGGFQRELAALGYDVRSCGERVAEVRAA